MNGRTLVVTNDFPPRVGGIESFVLRAFVGVARIPLTLRSTHHMRPSGPAAMSRPDAPANWMSFCAAVPSSSPQAARVSVMARAATPGTTARRRVVSFKKLASQCRKYAMRGGSRELSVPLDWYWTPMKLGAVGNTTPQQT